MEKGRGKRTDTLHRDNDYLQRGDVKRLLENVVCLHEELPAQIDLIPAADVVPVVHGKWHSRFYYRESTKAYDCEMHVCSECGSEWSYDAETGSSDFNYCPNCGARMDGDGE